MVTLPVSIETYLQEAGFSTTELLILKKLLEGQSLSVRELAARTGKSTGVLTQATRKMIDRGILTKEYVNEMDKYVISSLDVIKNWVAEDMQKQHDAIERKKLDFDAFLATVKHEKGRPDMEFFEGISGIEQAFKTLLEKNAKEWIHFVPGIMREEDDPIHRFRVEMFRERRRRGIFMRCIGPNLPLGRRFKSADAYHYRQTKLVDAEDFPVTFEKYIVGNTVACIDLIEHKASFIHYPDLAEGQRKMFNMMWREAGKEDPESTTKEEEEVEVKVAVPWKTRVVSTLRECFLSKRAMLALAGSALVALLITAGMYKYTLELMKDEIGKRLMSIVATAAPEIDARDLIPLRFARDMRREEYQRVFNKLNDIRDQNEDVWYSYVMRPTNTEGQYEFVADADSNYFLPDPEDLEPEEVVPPGTYYSTYFFGKEYKNSVLVKPVAESDFVTDKWGTYLSAAAPIFDTEGKTAAFLGIDMDVTDFYEKVNLRFQRFFWFIGILLSLFVIRFIILLRLNICRSNLLASHKA